MSMPRTNIVKVDLADNLKRYERGVLLASADKAANKLGAEVYQNGKAASLTGYTVVGYFIRTGVDTITINGTIEGNKAYVVLPASCYMYDGAFTLSVKLCKSGYEQTLAIFDGFIAQTVTNRIIDSANVVPVFETILKRNCYNLLDNSDFKLNQRGKTTYTGSVYSVDRWRAYHAATTHTVTTAGIAVSATDNNANLYQVLDKSNIDDAKTYTAAACDSAGNVYVWTGKPSTNVSSPVCMYYNGSTLLFRMVGNKTWRWAALYEGEYSALTLPPYQPKGCATELMECNRYAIPLGGVFRYRAVQIAGSIIDFSIPLPVPMRARPSFDASALTVYSIPEMNAQSGFTFAIVQETANGIVIRATKTGHGLTDAVLGIASNTIFSADL